MTGTVLPGDPRILDLLTLSEVTLRLRVAPETVRRLADAGVLVSVAAYVQRQAAGGGA